MGVLFGILLLLLLAAGLYYRRRQRRDWLNEERYEESGQWLDKRAGERGTYGALDAEREQERLEIRRQGRSIELARLIRDFAFTSVPGFADRSDADIRTFNQLAREQASGLLRGIESGQLPESPASGRPADALSEDLKKRMLDYAYREFPALPERDLEWIRGLDARVNAIACRLLESAEPN